MSIGECAKNFNLCKPVTSNILKEHNVKKYSKSKIFNPDMNEDYFKTIDTERKAYWLGLLITDGNIHKPKDGNRQTSISITQSKDREYILKEFIKDINASTNVAHDGRGASTVAIRSDIMAKDLEKYGVVPNKSLISFLPIIRIDLMPHLIRGILDGDGNISSNLLKTNKHKHSIGFCGTHDLMNGIGEFIHNELKIRKPSIYDYKSGTLSEIKWGSINDCYKLGEWLYKDSTIYIQSKRDKYLDFKNHYKLY